MRLNVPTRILLLLILTFALLKPDGFSQQRQPAPPADPVLDRIRALEEALGFLQQSLAKDIDDLMWMRALDDVAIVDRVRYTGPPPRVIPTPRARAQAIRSSLPHTPSFQRNLLQQSCRFWYLSTVAHTERLNRAPLTLCAR